MADETNQQPAKQTPRERQDEGTKKYFAAIKAGNKQLAKEIYDEYKLPYSVATHS